MRTLLLILSKTVHDQRCRVDAAQIGGILVLSDLGGARKRQWCIG